jgi:hypothetical protein
MICHSAAAFSRPLIERLRKPRTGILGGSYDANGNPSGGNVWDVENRLIGTGGHTQLLPGHYELLLRPVGAGGCGNSYLEGWMATATL